MRGKILITNLLETNNSTGIFLSSVECETCIVKQVIDACQCILYTLCDVWPRALERGLSGEGNCRPSHFNKKSLEG